MCKWGINESDSTYLHTFYSTETCTYTNTLMWVLDVFFSTDLKEEMFQKGKQPETSKLTSAGLLCRLALNLLVQLLDSH